MTIAILGYGKEGKSVENFFKKRNKDFKIFDKFTIDELKTFDLSPYEMVFRTPSVKPLDNSWTSSTKYFFDHCPCKIIGVTGTKGKGTTCSMITAILKALGKNVFLVGNIGNPSLDVLDELEPDDIVVYEMSSFQLWDLKKSPNISVVVRIEPDHLDVHKDYDDYLNAKSHIAEFQKKTDSCIYFKNNPDSKKIAEKSPGRKITYPIDNPSETLKTILTSLNVPGNHNKENAEAAISAVACYFNQPIETFIKENADKISKGLSNFHGLPHRIEYVRTINNIDFYDDNYSASFPSLDVAVKAFPNRNIILIAGGKNRNLNLKKPKDVIFRSKNVAFAVLIGETKQLLAENEDKEKFTFAENLEDAVNLAHEKAKNTKNATVLMSPGAASFDMFKNFTDRGEQFQTLVKGLN